jgi:phage gp36-like protein
VSYVTANQLAAGPGALKELTELGGVASPELMAATISGADRSSWTADEIEVADAMLASINQAIALADSECDARLRQRGYVLPIDVLQFPVLTVWARAIARYHLNLQRDRTNEETGRVERDYRDALRALQLVADGKLSLGANDPLAPATPSAASSGPSYCADERVFDRNSLADY